MVYRLITENTVEEKIRERGYIKLKWENMVM
jgi:SNF2 family DNA or RNA helicase